jgi:formyltetrahydrofolate-dependent phosphoribosylglycinamide formyltransferase
MLVHIDCSPDDAGIRTARWIGVGPATRERGVGFIAEHDGRCVVKADGLALGKGVTVCSSVAEAVAALEHLRLALLRLQAGDGSVGDVTLALERARREGIPAVVLNHRDFPSRAAFETALRETLESFQVGLVCLAGFLRILSPTFVRAFAGRMMNIHPALLPAFGGKGMYGEKVHQAVLASGARMSGCTVHFVSEIPDGGPIVLQAAVPVRDDDTPATLAARVRREEHHLYPLAVRLFAEGRLPITGHRVRILPEAIPPSEDVPAPDHPAAARTK